MAHTVWSETLGQFGPFWDNYDGTEPRIPYQPEFVMFTIRKYRSGKISLNSVEIHSDNDLKDHSPAKKWENWYKCHKISGFMIGTIDSAHKTCQEKDSIIKTFYSQVNCYKSD